MHQHIPSPTQQIIHMIPLINKCIKELRADHPQRPHQLIDGFLQLRTQFQALQSSAINWKSVKTFDRDRVLTDERKRDLLTRSDWGLIWKYHHKATFAHFSQNEEQKAADALWPFIQQASEENGSTIIPLLKDVIHTFKTETLLTRIFTLPVTGSNRSLLQLLIDQKADSALAFLYNRLPGVRAGIDHQP